MNPKIRAIIYRFALGLVLTEIPIVSAGILQPNFDWKLAGAGLLGGLAAAIEKWVAPQLLSVLADEGAAGPVLPVTAAPMSQVQVSSPPVSTSASSTGSGVAETKPPIPPEKPSEPEPLAPGA